MRSRILPYWDRLFPYIGTRRPYTVIQRIVFRRFSCNARSTSGYVYFVLYSRNKKNSFLYKLHQWSTHPAGTQRCMDVVWTLLRRQNVKTTSIQRCVPAGYIRRTYEFLRPFLHVSWNLLLGTKKKTPQKKNPRLGDTLFVLIFARI